MELRRANDSSAGAAIVFLPGILMPAALRYAPLVERFGDSVQAFTKELEVYDTNQSRDTYSIDVEVAGVTRAADAAGLDRFFLYGHSAGGAVALAFATAYPARLLGLGLDEPATDFTDETNIAWARHLGPISSLSPEERIPAFMRAQVATGVELPAPPAGPAPEWMASRPGGIEAFANAIRTHRLHASPSVFAGPVYYSFGSRTNPIWREICARLADKFPDFTSEEYQGLHHLNTSHAADPARVAAALRRVWSI